MKIGMLWFDNDPKADLKVKIERAASYYSKKYGQAPNLCFVHPSMTPATNPAQFAGGNGNGKPQTEHFSANAEYFSANAEHFSANIEVRTNRSVLPNHFWIGIAESQTSA